MDKNLIAFKNKNPIFMLTYKTSRTIMNPTKMFGRIKGRIRSGVEEGVISGAIVSLDNTLFASISNSKGNYSINQIPFGEYTIIVTAPSYCDISKTNIQVKLGKVLIIDFEMTPLTVLDEVATTEV